MSRMTFGCAALALILVSTPVWGFGRHPVPQGPTDTLMLGWERQFTLEWSPEPAPHQTNRIAGYVINHSGHGVDHMRVLAQAFDTSGALIGKRMAWVVGGVSPFGRASFEIGDVPAASRYRVTVWDHDTIES